MPVTEPRCCPGYLVVTVGKTLVCSGCWTKWVPRGDALSRIKLEGPSPDDRVKRLPE